MKAHEHADLIQNHPHLSKGGSRKVVHEGRPDSDFASLSE